MSHDRYFLDRVITRLLYMRHGRCEEYQATTRPTRHTWPHKPACQLRPRPKTTLNPATRPSVPRPARRRKLRVIEQEVSRAEAELAALQAAIERQASADWQQLAELTTQQGNVAARLESLMQEWEEAMTTKEES